MHAKHTCVMRWDTELVVCCTEVTAETLAKSPTLLLAARPLATVGTTAGVYVPGPTTAGVAARASKRGLLLNAIAPGPGDLAGEGRQQRVCATVALTSLSIVLKLVHAQPAIFGDDRMKERCHIFW